MVYTFPFGQQFLPVKQEDRSPKLIFCFRRNASAVHVRWRGVDGKAKINAMTVASEPYIFWKSDRCREIIKDVSILKEIGKSMRL